MAHVGEQTLIVRNLTSCSVIIRVQMAGDVLILSSAAGEYFCVDTCTASLMFCRSFCRYAHVCAIPSEPDVVHLHSRARSVESSDLNGHPVCILRLRAPLIRRSQYTFIISPPTLWHAPTYQTCTIDDPNVSNLCVVHAFSSVTALNTNA